MNVSTGLGRKRNLLIFSFSFFVSQLNFDFHFHSSGLPAVLWAPIQVMLHFAGVVLCVSINIHTHILSLSYSQHTQTFSLFPFLIQTQSFTSSVFSLSFSLPLSLPLSLSLLDHTSIIPQRASQSYVKLNIFSNFSITVVYP